jgi:hypothetical protein
MGAAKSLILSYESGDDEQFQQFLKSGIIRAMDNAYLRITKDLHAPGSNKTADGEGNDDGEDLR